MNLTFASNRRILDGAVDFNRIVHYVSNNRPGADGLRIIDPLALRTGMIGADLPGRTFNSYSSGMRAIVIKLTP